MRVFVYKIKIYSLNKKNHLPKGTVPTVVVSRTDLVRYHILKSSCIKVTKLVLECMFY